MSFTKYTAPPPPPPKAKPHVKFVRTIIQFTEDGSAHLAEIAKKLKDATHVHLWHDPDTAQIAITPAPANDRDAFLLSDGKIQAKAFWESVGIKTPIKAHGKTVEAHEEGVKLRIDAAGATRRRQTSSNEVTLIPKRSGVSWKKPGDRIPTRGKKSAALLAYLETDEGKADLAAQKK